MKLRLRFGCPLVTILLNEFGSSPLLFDRRWFMQMKNLRSVALSNDDRRFAKRLQLSAHSSVIMNLIYFTEYYKITYFRLHSGNFPNKKNITFCIPSFAHPGYNCTHTQMRIVDPLALHFALGFSEYLHCVRFVLILYYFFFVNGKPLIYSNVFSDARAAAGLVVAPLLSRCVSEICAIFRLIFSLVAAVVYWLNLIFSKWHEYCAISPLLLLLFFTPSLLLLLFFFWPLVWVDRWFVEFLLFALLEKNFSIDSQCSALDA